MRETPRLLCASDLSAAADRALLRAIHLARTEGASLTILHVPGDVGVRSETDAARAFSMLVRQVEALCEGLLPMPPVRALPGPPADAIADAIEQLDIDLAILGPAQVAALAGLFTSPRAARVLRLADCPVLSVRGPFMGPYREALLATAAGSEPHDAARMALDLFPGTTVAALHVVDLPFRGLTSDPARTDAVALGMGREILNHWLDHPALAAATVEPVVLVGPDPATLIVGTAGQRAADVVVVSTRVTSRIVRALIGSVAERVLAEAPCDVLAVPPAGGAAIDG